VYYLSDSLFLGCSGVLSQNAQFQVPKRRKNEKKQQRQEDAAFRQLERTHLNSEWWVMNPRPIISNSSKKASNTSNRT